MRVLLVNPYIYDFTAYDLWLRPLGLLYIAAILKKYSNCELYWLDTLDRFAGNERTTIGNRGKYFREVVDKPDIFKNTPRLYARYGIPFQAFLEKLDTLPDIDLVLVTSLMTYWGDGVNVTIAAIRKRFPAAKIVLGGILPSLVPAPVLRAQIDADYYIAGYGEAQILPLVQALGAKVYDTPDLSHPDALPYPAVEFLTNRDALPLMTSRGCPFHCTYCASDILNQKFIERRSESILAEIYHMHEKFGTSHFVIFDDALLINKRNRFLNVFQQVKNTLHVRFHTPNGLHTSQIDQETAEVIYGSGFETLRLSFESTSPDILSRSSDKVTVTQMVEAVKNLEAAGYERKNIGVYLLFGLPGQKEAQMKSALEFVRDLGVTPNLSYYSPVPGTVDFQNLQKSAVLSSPVNLYETNKIYFLYNKSGFTHQQIKNIKELASQIFTQIRA